MAKKPTGSTLKKDPIFTWAFQSSKPRAGGTVINYETRLNDNGSLSCNCPGWIFSKNDPKACKHTRIVDSESPGIFKMWKNGEELPVMHVGEATTGSTSGQSSGKEIKFGRVLQLED